jgi:hypothetical protein
LSSAELFDRRKRYFFLQFGLAEDAIVLDRELIERLVACAVEKDRAYAEYAVAANPSFDEQGEPYHTTTAFYL